MKGRDGRKAHKREWKSGEGERVEEMSGRKKKTRAGKGMRRDRGAN